MQRDYASAAGAAASGARFGSILLGSRAPPLGRFPSEGVSMLSRSLLACSLLAVGATAQPVVLPSLANGPFSPIYVDVYTFGTAFRTQLIYDVADIPVAVAFWKSLQTRRYHA